MKTTKAIKPYIVHRDTDDDGDTTVHLFWNRPSGRDEAVTIPQIIRDYLELYAESRYTFIESRGEKTSPYRGSGEWGHYRSEGALVISVDVGCYCEHDCCGHLCGLSFTINICGPLTMVVERRRYNV